MSDEARYRAAERQLFQAAGVAPEERWLSIKGREAPVRVLEVGEGRPALFLSGGPNAAATWAFLAAACRGLRCLLLDRPGTGLSPRLPRAPDAAALPAYVAGLTVEVLDALGLERACLVGSSLGGYSALRAAAASPERVERLVLVGCPAFVPRWQAPSFFTLLRTPLLGRLLLSMPATAGGARMSLVQLGHRRSLDAGRIPPEMVAWIHAWQRDTDTLRNDAEMIIACGSWRGGFDPSLELRDEDLAAVAAPCLVLGGGDDPVGDAEVVEHLAGLLPRGRAETLPGGGHLPWLDDPGWVAQRLAPFLLGGGQG